MPKLLIECNFDRLKPLHLHFNHVPISNVSKYQMHSQLITASNKDHL